MFQQQQEGRRRRKLRGVALLILLHSCRTTNCSDSTSDNGNIPIYVSRSTSFEKGKRKQISHTTSHPGVASVSSSTVAD
jgi:hypothetical protein